MSLLVPAAQRDWEATVRGFAWSGGLALPLLVIVAVTDPALTVAPPMGALCALVVLLARPPMRYPAAEVLAPAPTSASTAPRPAAPTLAIPLPEEFQDLPEQDEAAPAAERRRRKGRSFDDPS